MASYYVNKRAQLNGDHEVHNKSLCPPQYFPSTENAQYLGEFSNCRDAVTQAKQQYRTANGCAYCSPACHTS